MYKSRTVSEVIKQAADFFPVILLTGPRQVGKTTVLNHCAADKYQYVTLDDLEQRRLAIEDPALFLQRHQSPLIIDEVQYAPELFSQIKIAVDSTQQNGQYWLTGSQKFHLMKNITETLAGRIAVLDLLGLSQAEICGLAHQHQPFLPTQDWLVTARQSGASKPSLMDLYERIWLGSYPKLLVEQGVPRDIFYNSYIQTYISRDVRALTHVGDEGIFYQFLRAVAARTGQLVNFSQLANELDVDAKTIKQWTSILETSGIIYLLKPYYNNIKKRIIKTPKLYFLDTGLACFLTQWSSAKALEAGAMSGEILETYVVAEILKSYWHNGQVANIFFYRDRDQKEIDVLLEQDDILYPVEIKKTATPSQQSYKHFSVVEKLGKKVGPGYVVCLRDSDVPLSRNVTAVPVGYI